MMKKLLPCCCLLFAMLLSACSDTVRSDMTLTDTPYAGQSPDKLEINAADTAAAAIAAAMTVDYNAEERAFAEGSIFLNLLGAHWEEQYILKNWEQHFPIHELELEVSDSRYGEGKARFRGAYLSEIFASNQVVDDYYGWVYSYDNSSSFIRMTHEELAEQEICIMAYCEDKLFGMRDAGKSGPLVLMSTADGKAEILQTNVVSLMLTRGSDEKPPAGVPAENSSGIAAALTVDYTVEQREFAEASIFVYLHAGHWSAHYLLKSWPQHFPVHELELQVDDVRCGSGKALFSGSRIADIIDREEVSYDYQGELQCTDSSSNTLVFTREEIAEQELYLMSACEGRLFGLRGDNALGPLILMSVNEGRGEILQTGVVSLSLRRDPDASYRQALELNK